MSEPYELIAKPPDPRIVTLYDAIAATTQIYDNPPADPSSALPEFAGMGMDKTLWPEVDPPAPAYTQSAGFGAFNARFIPGEDDWSGDVVWYVRSCKYQFLFHPTATCFFKIEWDEVTHEIVVGASMSVDSPYPGAIVSSVPMSFTWEPPEESGYCVPAGFDDEKAESEFPTNPVSDGVPRVGLGLQDPSLLTIWPSTDIYTIGVPVAVNHMVRIENIRWSCVEGYTPPTDGSANGWPV